jgi:hypothetical protein
VPKLDLTNLPQYQTSDEEAGEETATADDMKEQSLMDIQQRQ